MTKKNLKIQISDYDSYQTKSSNLDQLCGQVSRVPVIRLYGSISVPLVDPSKSSSHPSSSSSSAENGEQRQHAHANSLPSETSSSSTSSSSAASPSLSYNIIVHIHNYYPYVFVDCHEKNPNLETLTNYIEVALKNSFKTRRRKRNNSGKNNEDENDDDDDDDNDVDNRSDGADDDKDNQNNTRPEPMGKRLYIANVALCKATPIYGFNVGYQQVYKISLLSPSYKTTLVKLINEGSIVFGSSSSSKASKRLRNVYEGHIPYLLQFVTDYNLFGCSWMEISSCYWRVPIFNSQYKADDSGSKFSRLKQHLAPHITHSNVLDPINFERTGHPLLEADIRSEHICNRSFIKIRELHTKLGRVEFHQSEKFLTSLDILSKDIAYQSKVRGSEFNFSSQLQRTEKTGGGGTKWSNQQELDDLLDYVSEMSRGRHAGNAEDGYDGFSDKYYNDTLRIPTAFDLVDIQSQILNYNGGLLLMSFGRDLKMWEKLDDLWWDETRYIQIGDAPPSAPQPISRPIDEETSQTNHLALHEPEVEQPAILDDSSPFPSSPSPPVVEVDVKQVDNDNLDFSFSENESEIAEIEDELSLIDSFDASQMDQVIFTQKFTQRKKGDSSLKSQDLVRFAERSHKSFTPLSSHSFLSITPSSLSKQNIMNTFDEHGVLKIDYVNPHFDNARDKPPKAFVFANKKIPVACIFEDNTAPFAFGDGVEVSHSIKSQLQSDLKKKKLTEEIFNHKVKRRKSGLKAQPNNRWLYVPAAPTKKEVKDWITIDEPKRIARERKFISQLERFTATNDYKFSYRSEKVARKPDGFNYLTSFNLEIHCNSTTEKLPNPSEDPIDIIFYSFDDRNFNGGASGSSEGILVCLDPSSTASLQIEKTLSKIPHLSSLVSVFYNEEAMIGELVSKVRFLDPDILCGYEIISSSWGYIIERFRAIHDVNLCHEFSRSTFKSNGKVGDRWGYTHTSNIKIPGRHMLNIWRVLRHEFSLNNYSLENVAYHLIHETVPKFSNQLLTSWFLGNGPSGNLTEAVLRYYMKRLHLSYKYVEVQEVILRNSEQSRLIGVDFYSNFYRGSQYKVESILLRLTKAENLLLNSPSKQQVHEMRSLECIPLIMEPDSNFYKSPLIVLDFQSLYPSIVIAYNYCYSTLIGKLKGFEPKKNGVGYLKSMKLQPGIIDILKKNDDIIVSPNGYMFVKSRVRKSVLAKMLEEILEARINVKTLMKKFGKNEPELEKLYNSKQLALKLIANVTYGYTSATFSGRMPNSDIADAIVSTGREILSQSIDIIDGNPDWGAKVVYGDTDSLFVYLPGKSKSDAFKIGREISTHISSQFPNPLFLKFEKVYHPSVLLSKKRYVGYSYEYEEQKVPKFDAKGIETIRRDGIPAQQIILERSLKTLFDTSNISQVKRYVMEQFYKVVLNKVSVKDFCFAKEVRYGTYKNEKYLPPGAVISKKKVEQDARSEPQYKERVPYLVIHDSSKIRIKDRCVSPEDFVSSFTKLKGSPYKLDHEYYVTRVLIPPLARIFNLIGVDIKSWYKELPQFRKNKEKLGDRQISAQDTHNDNTSLFGNLIKQNSCVLCSEQTKVKGSEFCRGCLENELETVASLSKSIKQVEVTTDNVLNTCDQCATVNYGPLGSSKRDLSLNCENFNCTNYFERLKAMEIKSRDNQRRTELLSQW